MSGLIELCEKYFQTKNLYEVLDISKQATEKEVKKAYHKLSLKVHPDRVHEDDKLEATEKFKVLGGVHSILSDDKKRAVYDETGTIDDEGEPIVQKDWSVYWRILFKVITDEDIINYEKNYIGSEEELQDLKKAYLAGKGDMDYIVDHVQFARSEQEPRLRDLINKMIENEEVPPYKIFTHEPEKKRKRRHAKENREAAEAAKQEHASKRGGSNDLVQLLQQRQQARAGALDSFLDGLAAKYSEGPSRTTRKSAQKSEAPKRRTRKM